ncbi:hypothetical protein ACHAQA_005219 [Verticillium albo-atrum]
MAASLQAQPSPEASSPFNKVPLEIVLRIANDLSTTELCSLRLTCRSIERFLFTTFSREFFSKRQFMLTEDSLQALIDISRSRIGDCLKHVIIGLDHFKKRDNLHSQLQISQLLITRYTAGFEDQQTFLWSGQATIMLSEALRTLQPTVLAMRDYASDARRHRDGPDATWASYGATTVRKETGFRLLGGSAFDDNISAYANQTFSILLAAVASSGVSPTRIEVLQHRGGGLSPIAFNIPNYLKPSLLPALSKLETVFLPLNLVGSNARWAPPASSRYITIDQQSAQQCPDYLLRIFLAYLPNLKHLRLNFRRRDKSLEFMSWLATPASGGPGSLQASAAVAVSQIPPPPPSLAFPHLERLEFGIVAVAPDVLLSVIKKFAPTLRGLELWKVALLTGSAQTHQPQHQINVWKSFLDRLRHVPGLKLQHMMIGQPSQQDSIGSTVNVHFQSLSSGPGASQVMQKRAYLGNEWDEWIQDIHADVTIEWPKDNQRDAEPNNSGITIDPVMGDTDEESGSSQVDEENDDEENDEEMFGF